MKEKLAWAYDRVLDLGVGNLHFYESWRADHGGDMQAQFVDHPFNARAFTFSYATFNGPIVDADGYVDGTCNFYLLVHFPGDEGAKGRYGIVCRSHEQSYFSTRWRLLTPSDNLPVEFDPLSNRTNFSLGAALATSYGQELFRFDIDRYWDPFQDGCIDDRSRMAVSRQIIAVTGTNPDTARHEIYTINSSWGTMDRTWRWRAFGVGNSLRAKPGRVLPGRPTEAEVVLPETLTLREDLMLVVQGTAQAPDGAIKRGAWSQRYLPANCLPLPAAEALTDGRPTVGYHHPWQFLREPVFEVAQHFGQLGVYQHDTNSRSQYYLVDIVEGDEPSRGVDGSVLVEEGDTLYIKARDLNWRRIAALADHPERLLRFSRDTLPRIADRRAQLQALDELSDDLLIRWHERPEEDDSFKSQSRRSRTSRFHRHARFRLAHRGPLGWIAMWDDRRDDDLMAISDLPRETDFTCDGSRLRLRLRANVRVARPPVVEVAWVRPGGSGIELAIRTSERPLLLGENLWRVHMGALDVERPSPCRPVARASVLFSDVFEPDPRQEGVYVGQIRMGAEDSAYFTPVGRWRSGTSVWFEGATGMMATAEALHFDAWFDDRPGRGPGRKTKQTSITGGKGVHAATRRPIHRGRLQRVRRN